MKNDLFLFCLVLSILFCPSSTHAQIGIRGGIGISDIAFLNGGQTPYLSYEVDYLEHRKPTFSWLFGGYANIDLANRFGLQPELLFSKQGLDYSKDFLYDAVQYKVNLHYLQMPVLLKYKISEKSNRESAVLIGIYASWKLNAVRVTKIEGERNKTKMNNVKASDFGVIAGYSMGFKVPDGLLDVDLRASYSLFNMMDPLSGHVPSYKGPSKAYVRNVNISLTTGYRFDNF